jgi:hypothetical protein
VGSGFIALIIVEITKNKVIQREDSLFNFKSPRGRQNKGTLATKSVYKIISCPIVQALVGKTWRKYRQSPLGIFTHHLKNFKIS